MSLKSLIFQSVFPVAGDADTPTPLATPLVDAGSFDIRPGVLLEDDLHDVAAQNIKWQRAWHTSTTYLSLPRTQISLRSNAQEESALQKLWMRPCPAATSEAVAFVIRSSSKSTATGAHDGLTRLIDWYSQEVTRHFVEFQLPLLKEILDKTTDDEALPKAVKLLQFSQKAYFYKLEQTVLVLLKTKAQAEFSRFRDTFHGLVANSLFYSKLSEHLSSFLYSQTRVLFAGSQNGSSLQRDDSKEIKTAVATMQRILQTLDDIGLGGAQVQRILAEVVDDGLTAYIANEYSENYWHNEVNADQVRAWIDERLFPAIMDAISALPSSDRSSGSDWGQQLFNEVLNWKERAVHELAALRLEEAFKIIVGWQHNLPSGLSDLSPFTKSMGGRAFIVNKFTTSVVNRLLHPGASTIEILQMYVHIIIAFLELDPKGVLLDRISRPLRRYLRERSDTVKTIIQGLLLDPMHDSDAPEPLEELSRVLSELQERQAPEEEEDAELYDLNWEPDPIDAAPEYRADERAEIIGSLIDIFDNKEVFIKEFQNILSDRLLQQESEFHREIQVLELFKKRIGESHLQACEVMMKDIIDSRRIEEYVKRERKLEGPSAELFKTKILSRFYWPSLEPEEFKVPKHIKEVQDAFSAGFEIAKTSRKLNWLNSLGRVKVALELKDRIVEEEVHTWQATVINEFAESGLPSGESPSRTAEEIQERLQMDDDLVQAALSFWVGKMVLRKQGAHYSVLERLPSTEEKLAAGDGTASNLAANAVAASASAAAADVGGVRRNEAKVAEEKMAVFWQFIQNMLRNQGAMPLSKIVMMLKLAVAGGFPYTEEELKAFLAKKVEAGELQLSGGSYKPAQSK